MWTSLGRGHYIQPAPKQAAVDGRAVTKPRTPGLFWVSLCLDGDRRRGGTRVGKEHSFPPHPTPNVLCTWPVTSHGPKQDSPTGRKKGRAMKLNKRKTPVAWKEGCCVQSLSAAHISP